MVDYYAILGVNPNAEDIVIRAAYKALAQRYHPDRFAGSKDEAHRRMSELTQAYEVLADPVRRPKYDRRRKLYTRAVAARFNHARRFASVALDPRAYRSIREIRGRYRAALAALMGAVVVLSAFNLYTHAGRIKASLGFGGNNVPSSLALPHVPLADALSMGPPAPSANSAGVGAKSAAKEKKRSGNRNPGGSRPAKSAPAATAAQPCDDVSEALALCIRDRRASN